MAEPAEVDRDGGDAGQAGLDRRTVLLSSPLRYRISTGDSSYRRLDHRLEGRRVQRADVAADNHGALHEERPLGEAGGHRDLARCVNFLINRCSRPLAPLHGDGRHGGQGGRRRREPHPRREGAVAHSNDFK